MTLARIALVFVVALAAGTARAQQATIEDTLTAQKFDAASCLQAAGPPPVRPAGDLAPPPVTWSGFELVGELSDDSSVVRALFEPTMRRHRALTEDARSDIRRIAAAFGYHLVGLGTREQGGETLAVVHVAPLPLVRRIDVHTDLSLQQKFFATLFDDEIRRRMRVHAGSYLPWTPKERACELYDEVRRIEEFLREEGYIDARAQIGQKRDGGGLQLSVNVRLGSDYETGIINIAGGEPSVISESEIRNIFRHRAFCLVRVCAGEARFRREQHQKDLQTVIDLYRQRGGFPSVRVRSDFDPLTSFDRRTKRVNFTITIDQRRQVLVLFEGQSDAMKVEDLRKQLTFDQAQSADDVEAGESAKALATYLQSKGYFDARVTWTRERFERFDHIIFRIEQGDSRTVKEVTFRGHRALGEDKLRGAIGTSEVKLTTSLFGRSTAATSARLSADVDGLVDLYRREGFREARIRVSAASERAALGDAAMTAAMVLADRGDGLYVRFDIDEGQPTLLTQVEVSIGKDGGAIATPEDRELCASSLTELASYYREPQLAKSAAPDRCIALAANLRFREGDADGTREQLKDTLFSLGRPRAKVDLAIVDLGPHRVAARYTLTDVKPLTIGKIVLRGNFRTRDSIILGELAYAGMSDGALLTKDRLAEGARKLRGTGLFDAVNIAMPDLDGTSEGSVNAVVEVTERYDRRFGLDLEFGASTYNGLFVTLVPSIRNIFGRGISLDVAGTIGLDLPDLFERQLTRKQLAVEATLRIPDYLARQVMPNIIAPTTELTGFHRTQDTERFGLITTDGVTLSFSRTWSTPRTETHGADAITAGVYYDFRRRERPVDVLRPAGADNDDSQVPISTRTGSVGLSGEWEARTDRNGTLSPLAPERGFRLEGRASFAAPALFGQDTFIKLSAAGSRFHLVGDNLLLRADVRYDQGIPLAGAVLLPEVERFFAGGDSTVRGYEDDRLATEIIQVAVPPFDNVSQIRVLPSGGNIRVMGSLDAQLRIWKLFASAIFVDAGMISNTWSSVDLEDIKPAIGVALLRINTPFGIGALERAIPLNPNIGDNPRGRWHFSFAARAQF